MANGFIPRFAAKLHARAPDCRPSIFSVPSTSVVDYVVGEKCDLGIATTGRIEEDRIFRLGESGQIGAIVQQESNNVRFSCFGEPNATKTMSG